MRGDYDYGVTVPEGGYRLPPAYLQQTPFLRNVDFEEMEARAAEINTDAETSGYGERTVPWLWQRYDHEVHENWEQRVIHENEITVRQETAAVAEEESGQTWKCPAAPAA